MLHRFFELAVYSRHYPSVAVALKKVQFGWN
jgi:hypothetical protein